MINTTIFRVLNLLGAAGIPEYYFGLQYYIDMKYLTVTVCFMKACYSNVTHYTTTVFLKIMSTDIDIIHYHGKCLPV